MCVDLQVWEALQQCETSSSVRDLHDGRKYRELEAFTSKGNLTLTVNTDGVQLFKSSTVSMWPIWVIINELPVTLR